MLATVQSAALHGIKAVPVQVEVNSGESGDPRLILVGLPDAAVKESNDRVFSALSTSGFRPPRTRTTINLAPGDLRKEGPIYDLPIALGILASTQQMTHPSRLESYVIAGELGLSGATRPVRGALAMAILAKENSSMVASRDKTRRPCDKSPRDWEAFTTMEMKNRLAQKHSRC